MSTTLKSFTVRFQEWCLYDYHIEATTPQEAIRQTYAKFCNAGPDSFKIRDNGTECWEAETELGKPVLEINHPTDLDDEEAAA